MARPYTYGYLDISTNKYGVFEYGEIKYGLNYPPPQPENLTVAGYPNVVDTTPVFSWTLPYADDDPLTYELQINYNISDFTSPTVDTDEFSAPLNEYELAPEYELTEEGTYYARIRSTDGLTYSDWSTTIQFKLYTIGVYPPTIDTVTNPADGFWQMITGTKQASLHVFIRNNDGDWTEVEYPDSLSGTTWQYNMPLVTAGNDIDAMAGATSDYTGAVSEIVSAYIYLIVKTPDIFNVWNHFDEFGLLLGLPRIRGEKNKDYKERLLDVYQNPANSTYSGLRYGISRELGLSYGDITIDRLSDLADEDYSGNLLNEDGNAIGTRLVDYANEVYDHNPIFYGNVISDESYWDGVDEETTGYSFLPHLWDPTASGVYPKWAGGGIGDQDDLRVTGPYEVYNETLGRDSWYLYIHSGYFYSAYPSGVIGV